MDERKTILVVEDEESLSHALRSKLTQEHYYVIAVGDGEKGLNSALNSHPNLILLDVIMPHMGGLEMLKRLRKDQWGKDVPIIMLTNISNVDESTTVFSDPHLELLIKSETSLEKLLTHIGVTLRK